MQGRESEGLNTNSLRKETEEEEEEGFYYSFTLMFAHPHHGMFTDFLDEGKPSILDESESVLVLT